MTGDQHFEEEKRYEEKNSGGENLPRKNLRRRKPTQREFLPRIWGQGEAKDCHRGDEHARDYQVEEIVHLRVHTIDIHFQIPYGVCESLLVPESTLPFFAESWRRMWCPNMAPDSNHRSPRFSPPAHLHRQKGIAKCNIARQELKFYQDSDKAIFQLNVN